MTEYRDWTAELPDVFDHLDGILDRAYFVPLSVGDALALQFRIDSLKGLPVKKVAEVMALMDRLEIEADPDYDGSPNPAAVANSFFQKLRKELPEIFELWASADANLVFDPAGAFSFALARGEEAIEKWLAAGTEQTDSSAYGQIRNQALADVMDDFDTARFPDDKTLRHHLREDRLASYPAWARPGIYLDCWAEFVRAVMDLSPRPSTVTRWPY